MLLTWHAGSDLILKAGSAADACSKEAAYCIPKIIIYKMKKRINVRSAIALLIISIIAVSCAKEEGDEDIVTLPRDKFIGTWHVSSHGSNSGDQFWDLVIEPASAAAAKQIVMKNFDQQGNSTTVYADVSGSNLLIPGTVVGAVTVEGTGYLSGALLTLDYTSTDSQTDTVHATATK